MRSTAKARDVARQPNIISPKHSRKGPIRHSVQGISKAPLTRHCSQFSALSHSGPPLSYSQLIPQRCSPESLALVPTSLSMARCSWHPSWQASRAVTSLSSLRQAHTHARGQRSKPASRSRRKRRGQVGWREGVIPWPPISQLHPPGAHLNTSDIPGG